MIQFPEGFLWGAATSAYQVEGNNINSDWWSWEKAAGLKEVSGEACRHYELYRQDFDLARSLNHNAHRLSLEWSRIEPEEGKFSSRELEHYTDVILSLKECNLEPIITLHHFSNPLWFAKLGGWQNRKASDYFLRFVEQVVNRFANRVRYWVTINEPLVYVYHAYILGFWPPQAKSLLKARRVEKNLTSAHIKAYKLIHSIYRNNKLNQPSVSIAKNMPAFVACRHNIKDRLSVYLRDRFFNFNLLDKLMRYRCLDFIGVNYYSRTLIEVEKWSLRNLMADVCKNNHHSLPKNSMGWDIYPEGLYSVLLKLKKYNLPIIILENGICTDDDKLRWDFIEKHLENINLAMEEGVNVTGYIYWSLIDNYEWDKGFGERFGLIEVDYNTYQRTIRESAKKFSLVCKTGRLD
jgi:beta-glucosidase